MAVDIEKIKKMVDKISSLTVLELSKLVKALMDKFGSRTSARVKHSPTEVEETEAVSEEPAEVEETEAVSEEPTEVKEASTKYEEKSKLFPDPSSVEVPDELDDEPDDEPDELDDEPDDEPEGERYDLVYAWQYSGDNRYAKIGRSTRHLLQTRMRGTYHPTDTPELIGIWGCENRKHAEDVQNYILRELKRMRPDREWVEIDEAFNEMIDNTFISDPNVLREIFAGTLVKIKKP